MAVPVVPLIVWLDGAIEAPALMVMPIVAVAVPLVAPVAVTV
jgi:hypothetical protein